MRKTIVFNAISLDGYHKEPGNDVSVMFPMMGGVFDTYTAELLRSADVTLADSRRGRRTAPVPTSARCWRPPLLSGSKACSTEYKDKNHDAL